MQIGVAGDYVNSGRGSAIRWGFASAPACARSMERRSHGRRERAGTSRADETPRTFCCRATCGRWIRPGRKPSPAPWGPPQARPSSCPACPASTPTRDNPLMKTMREAIRPAPADKRFPVPHHHILRCGSFAPTSRRAAPVRLWPERSDDRARSAVRRTQAPRTSPANRASAAIIAAPVIALIVVSRTAALFMHRMIAHFTGPPNSKGSAPNPLRVARLPIFRRSPPRRSARPDAHARTEGAPARPPSPRRSGRGHPASRQGR